jgi:preprotein translocase subunit SecG
MSMRSGLTNTKRIILTVFLSISIGLSSFAQNQEESKDNESIEKFTLKMPKFVN